MSTQSDLTTFVCLFHDADRAHAAVKALEDAGIARSAITTLSKSDSTASSSQAESLQAIGVPERDLAHLRDGLSRGGVVLSLEAPESRSGEIERVFHHYNVGKIDETDTARNEVAAPAALAAAPVLAAAPARTNASAEDMVIPVAEESLVVGKREVDRGGVRVFRHTVSEPVQQDVNLHEEHVVVEHRAVNRAITDADLRAGTQEIELVETDEVPVVQKVARVVEEVRVGKVESDRTETVSDTVRHTEVDIEQVESTDADKYRR